jgi:transposase-like protein
MGEKKYKTYAAEFKVKKVEEYLKSGKSQREFCQENDINLTTFRCWMEKSQIATSPGQKEESHSLSLVEVTDRIRESMAMLDAEKKIKFSVNGFALEISAGDLPAFLACMKSNADSNG